jgi:ABC-type multidrug transport system ATPase subunit
MQINISELTKCYGSKMALKSFSASLEPGVYGLLGPNGAGKTTLMNIISGNLLPDSGSITLNGENISAMGNRFRDILGYMPQQQNLYDQFSARRFLWYMASLKGLPKKAAKERIEELLEMVNLKEDSHRNLGKFSGGMKQRILIAQALLNDPKILLMDEPTAGLDPRERIRIRNLISQISFNKIVILATHVVSDIEFIAREVILLKKGEVLAQEKPSHLLSMMVGKTFEVRVKEHEVQDVQQKFSVSNIVKDSDGISVRVVADKSPKDYASIAVKPNMEDVYLYMLEEKQ